MSEVADSMRIRAESSPADPHSMRFVLDRDVQDSALASFPDAVAGIADAVDPALLVGTYHEAMGALINQHGFNLLWVGTFTLVGAVYIWRGSITALFFTGIIGGLADIGYFVFMDLGGFVNFVPGTVMTLVSSAAIILSLVAYFGGLRGRDIPVA